MGFDLGVCMYCFRFLTHVCQRENMLAVAYFDHHSNLEYVNKCALVDGLYMLNNQAPPVVKI